MPQSLSNVIVHLVFSTKQRRALLRPERLRNELYAYMVGILRNQNCPSLIVNGVEDHVHCLCHLSRTITIAKLVEELKTSSSVWIKSQSRELLDFQWQSGYAAFSVSQSSVEKVRGYIANQEEHHQKLTFQDEFRRLLSRHQIDFDERYLWD